MATYTEEDMKEVVDTLTLGWKAITWASVGFTALFYCMALLFIYGTGDRYLIITGLCSMGLFGCWCVGKYQFIREIKLWWIK